MALKVSSLYSTRLYDDASSNSSVAAGIGGGIAALAVVLSVVVVVVISVYVLGRRRKKVDLQSKKLMAWMDLTTLLIEVNKQFIL